jgi:hypothetical protein
MTSVPVGRSANSFPYPVPSGIYVPHWALIDVTVRCNLSHFSRTDGTPQLENNWDSVEAMNVGGRNSLHLLFDLLTPMPFRWSRNRSWPINRLHRHLHYSPKGGLRLSIPDEIPSCLFIFQWK